MSDFPPSRPASVTVGRERADTADASALVLELEDHLASRYPAESRHGFSVERLVADGVVFFVARVDGVPAGCGGLLVVNNPAPGDQPYGEVKRMYVRPGFRGLGIGRRVLTGLIEHARDAGLAIVRLETGVDQVEAIGLYESAGFRKLARAKRVAGHHPGRFGQPRHPLRHLWSLRLPHAPLIVLDGAALPEKFVAGVAGLCHRRRESVTAPIGPEPAALADVSELRETTLQEVLGRHPADRLLVVEDQRQAQVPDLFVQVDDGNSRPPRKVGDLTQRKPGDDTVAPPLREPRRNAFANRSLLEIHRPGAVLANVQGDAAEHVPAVRGRGFDQQGHLGRRVNACATVAPPSRSL